MLKNLRSFWEPKLKRNFIKAYVKKKKKKKGQPVENRPCYHFQLTKHLEIILLQILHEEEEDRTCEGKTLFFNTKNEPQLF